MAAGRSSLRRAVLLVVVLSMALLMFRKSTVRYSVRPGPAPSIDDQRRFWYAFHAILKATVPGCKSPIKLDEHPTSLEFHPDNIGNITLPENLMLSKGDRRKLKLAHARFLRLLAPPDGPVLPFQKRTRGIVSTASKAMLPTLVTSIYMLRVTGSKLPVEIFLADRGEHDAFTCGILLRSLNTRCIILDEILSFSPLKEGLMRYQFKIFSLLFSSFEEAFFLDADAFPIHDPARLFTSKPFIATGMVTWPDFWQVTYHPWFFEITAQQLPNTFPIPSTESGQLLISKRTHSKLLLLSAYYNFHGPSYYYPLLSQGHPGEGNKETYVASAMVLNLPFYAVSTRPEVFGYINKNGEWEGGVIIQADPTWEVISRPDRMYGWKGKPAAPSNAFFTFHANLPKLDPIQVFGEGGLAWAADGSPQRMWGTARDSILRVGADIEKRLWNALERTSCQLEWNFAPWDGRPRLCEKIRRFIRGMA
ncbi:alpha-1,2-mannosyltransferase [Trichophyton equinum CBS 127.97]|uniref:Alpha-1,2-mannosyltransferase n=1 Tax=Trichophyton equinum (strain ATCC MYA-4606 / CBS 127.97) TaxID=559882 RepID=F2PUW6_TRIEC|nr:alpha-1,2-mannosyltransferase [Trichophyton equinum CBS 127.97]